METVSDGFVVFFAAGIGRYVTGLQPSSGRLVDAVLGAVAGGA